MDKILKNTLNKAIERDDNTNVISMEIEYLKLLKKLKKEVRRSHL